ncbi:efflux RND transporter periplasmic adaptor subunit [Shewanella sp. 1_MG-2023]|uniref:efflux RND transporter periplasmic adaptor subunit n=1 Tax=unclassified Shewanella TaxID=196818 RepID=UPI0026E44F97|nr:MULTISPECIES: efflux RND transporter periplasmic adaptor subunit [unclassified Shewanella]MDO6611417.1 efflux RND transporter periplasmic adaptor subunit [Shewanella sp. 7_MG-2023]MDO6771272.1 efflux RND transporter periplasmic adaptor subunit [Shewanella sp. 2_MG-2023]MDO6795513.1 efflux RND transporter periplasmic adaptor subunit [Shewanella sp. 1_MG-2023]
MKKLNQFASFLLITSTTFSCLFTFSASAASSDEATSVSSIPRPVKVEQVDIGTEYRERFLPGEVKASEKAALSFRVSGEIAQILVRPGDPVKAGDILATLDSDIYQQQLAVAQAQFELAKVLFERNESLVEQGVVSRNDYDQAKSDYTIAQAALDKAKADVTYTNLIAPYQGVISKRMKREFEFVQMQEEVMGIRTESAADISFQLPEQFIGFLQKSDKSLQDINNIEVKFDSRDHWYAAKLKELNTVADPTTSSYTIILTLPMPDELNVLPGMSAQVKVKLPARTADAHPKIPAGAMVKENQDTFVFVWLPEEKRIKKVAVTLQGTRLMTGLNDGDWLVVAGASELKDGQSAVKWIKERGL